MFDSSKLPSRTLASAVLVAAAIAVPAAQAASGPKIKATPKSVMVNTNTTLTGKGFPANSTIVLQECGVTSWVVGQEPCLTSNEKEVTTNAAGRFTTSFTVGLCPQSAPPPKKPVTERKCFIGEPKPFGLDQIELVGAAKVIVTFP